MKYDVIPFVKTHIVSKIREYVKHKAEQMQKEETKDEITSSVSSQKSAPNTISIVAEHCQNNLIDEQPTACSENDFENQLQKLLQSNNDDKSLEINVSPELEEKVFHLFYSVSTSKRIMNDCTTPSKFFDNYDVAIDALRELTEIERKHAYPFYEPYPSTQLEELENHENYVNWVNLFIKRYWYKVLNEASKYKTTKTIRQKISYFKTNLTPFASYIPVESQNLIDELTAIDLDFTNLPTVPKKKLEFDKAKEDALLSNLERQTNAVAKHYCYNDIIDFYFKYRNDYPKTVLECIKYCAEDIESIPSIEKEYINERIAAIKRLYSEDAKKQQEQISIAIGRGFRANIPAFDRITMLFFYEKDYNSAIYYCKLAIANGQDYDSKYTKRIDRFKKKRAAEEKRLHGSVLSHFD